MATFTIRLSQDAIWTNQGTWTFAIEGGVSVTGTINTSSPTTDKLLEFDVPLVTAVGDVVTVEYAPGNLRKASSDPGEDLMEPFGPVPITNCLNIPATQFVAKAISTTEIELTWTDPADLTGYEDYILKRDGVEIGTPAPGSQPVTDSGLTQNKTYSYTLQTRANGEDIGDPLVDSDTTFPDVPSTVDGWALEDGSGLWALEDGSGVWILE